MHRAQRSMRVLVAEDAPDISESIQEQLVRLGHSVAAVAYTGPEAVRLVPETRPDAVLIDLIMIDPETGREDRHAGERATIEIMGTSPCPVVWLTSYESQEAIRRAAEAGAAGYLVKPVEDSELDRALAIAAARFADARALTAANAELRRQMATRAAAEKALLESEERFRRVFEDSPTGMALVDSDDRIFSGNVALSEMLGTPTEQLLGRSLLELAHPEDRERLRSRARMLMAGEIDVIREDVRLLARQGQIVWARAGVRLLPDAGGGVGHLLVVLANITERKELEARLRFLSFHDALTGMYNRTFFEEEMARVGRSRRYPVSLLVADLDGLKSINDRLGHAAGDQAIRHAADVLRAAFRQEDVLARLGGDEFAAMMAGADASAAAAMIARVRTLAERHVGEGCACGLRLSLGVATAGPGESLLEALHLADVRMYEQKAETKAETPGAP